MEISNLVAVNVEIIKARHEHKKIKMFLRFITRKNVNT